MHMEFNLKQFLRCVIKLLMYYKIGQEFLLECLRNPCLAYRLLNMSILGEIPTTNWRPFKIATWQVLKFRTEKHTQPHMLEHYQPKWFLSQFWHLLILVTRSKVARYAVLTTIHKSSQINSFHTRQLLQVIQWKHQVTPC